MKNSPAYSLRVLAIFVIVTLNFSVQAQNYSMFWNIKSLFNPAASGLHQKYYAAVIGRDQWAGLKNAPMSGSAIFDVKLNTLHGGTGINFGYDQAGPGRTFTVNANYSYHINLQNDRVLSLGVSGGLSLANIDFSQIDMDDDQVIVSDVNYKLYHFKFGLFYASNHLDFGLSSTHVKVPEMLNADSRIINNYWMFCSYQFDIGENFGIKPNLLMRTPSNKMDVTLSSGLLMIYKERFWTGLSYTIDRSVGAVVGYDIKGMIRIGYSFNYSAYPYNKYSYGIHEIIFGLKIR